MLKELACRSRVVVLAFLAGIPSVTAAQWQPRLHLYAIGGGYETALKGYSTEVIRHARGPAVRIVMVPAAFGDDPVLPEDPVILAEDVAALQAACDSVVDRRVFPEGCDVGSVPLYVAADAHDAAIVATLRDPGLDGIFFNGGDQTYAMRVLALTPAEEAMDGAAERGVVFGGTSAGAAIESYFMNAGYTDTGYATTALQKASIDMWMAQSRADRGLEFGSQHVVLDQHVYARGRLGRMFNAGAQTADLLGGGGLLGIGVDYDTGIAIDKDRIARAVSGVSSAVVVDFRTANARHAWVGPNEALSARNVLTHLLPPNPGLTFDLNHRVPSLGGHRFEWRRPAPFAHPLRAEGNVALILAGDVSEDLAGPVIGQVVKMATVKKGNREGGRILVLAAGYPDPDDAQAQAESYVAALGASGWTGTSEIRIHGQDVLTPSLLKDVTGTLVIGGDQSRIEAAVADPAFRTFVQRAARESRVLMLEHAMTAAAGDAYCNLPDDADAIEAFRTAAVTLKPGLGLVHGAAFEPRLQTDYRWGRLYGLGARMRHAHVYGISESSAILIRGRNASVVGQNPVVALDARGSTFFAGDNGTLGAFNVLLDVYEPGEEIGR